MTCSALREELGIHIKAYIDAARPLALFADYLHM